MTESERTLFVQYDTGSWTADELQSAVDSMNAVAPDDTTVMLVGNGFDLMEETQVEELVTSLIEALD